VTLAATRPRDVSGRMLRTTAEMRAIPAEGLLSGLLATSLSAHGSSDQEPAKDKKVGMEQPRSIAGEKNRA
jgi:hypothetical protein